jgi:Cu2+-containing amine oxidase
MWEDFSSNRRSRMYKARFILGMLLTLLVFISSVQAAHPRGTLPFDPLSSEEISEAIAISLRDPQVVQELPKGARFRVIVVQLHEEALKGNEGESLALAQIPRRADVLLYRYDKDVTLSLLVDLGNGTVESFERLTEVQPPHLPEETAEALKIALREAQVLQRLAQLGIGPKMVSANGMLFTAQPPCLIHRCIELLLNTPEQSISAREDAFFPVVDLSAQRVDHIKTLEPSEVIP